MTAVRAAHGLDVAVHDLGGDGQPAVLVHAAGFHGRMFAPLARELARDVHSIAPDLRGHGESPLPSDAPLDWYGLAADVLAVVDGLGLERPFAFGHSTGGTAVLLAEQARPGTFGAIYCFEPILVAEDPPLGRDEENWLAAQARRRRTQFDSKPDAYQHLAAKPPFAGCDPECLHAYVDHGLEEDGEAGVRLRCSNETEATLYETATAHDAYPQLATVRCPVTVAAGRASDPWVPKLIRSWIDRLPAGRVEVVAGVGHFGPLERPDLIAGSVRRAFG